jgi:hypothetical protein
MIPVYKATVIPIVPRGFIRTRSRQRPDDNFVFFVVTSGQFLTESRFLRLLLNNSSHQNQRHLLSQQSTLFTDSTNAKSSEITVSVWAYIRRTNGICPLDNHSEEEDSPEEATTTYLQYCRSARSELNLRGASNIFLSIYGAQKWTLS